MVTSTIIGICHHEVNLVWAWIVKRNFSFNYPWSELTNWTILLSNIRSIIDSDTAVWGTKHWVRAPYLVVRSSDLYFCSKYVGWLGQRDKEPRIDISLLQNEKTTFKLASQATFLLLSPLYLFQSCQFSQKFYFFSGIILRWWQVQSLVHVTNSLICPVIKGMKLKENA